MCPTGRIDPPSQVSQRLHHASRDHTTLAGWRLKPAGWNARLAGRRLAAGSGAGLDGSQLSLAGAIYGESHQRSQAESLSQVNSLSKLSNDVFMAGVGVSPSEPGLQAGPQGEEEQGET